MLAEAVPCPDPVDEATGPLPLLATAFAAVVNVDEDTLKAPVPIALIAATYSTKTHNT